MTQAYRFNRMEFSGSLGDLGTLLPLVMGMVLINGMPVTGIFYTVGLFYIFAGSYFGVPVPVQPMKVISAYAIATGVSAAQVSGAAALVSVILLIIGLTGTIDTIGKIIPKSVIRGVQLSTGVLLIGQGLKFITGEAPYQQLMGTGEPFLNIQNIGPVPLTIILGFAGALITLFLLKNKTYPAGITVLFFGLFIGSIWGTHEGFDTMKPGLYFPPILPFGIPASADFTIALFVLVLPQLPMTIGNAVIANADLSNDYFGEKSKKVTYRATTLSMGLANGLAFFIGGIPLCHGAGGLAAHYNFGARTGGSNLIVGLLFLLLALFFGPHSLTLMHLLPLSILGVLLIFAGSQLGLSILDMFSRKDMFVIILMLCITLTSNLSWGFAVGIILAYLLRSEKIEI